MRRLSFCKLFIWLFCLISADFEYTTVDYKPTKLSLSKLYRQSILQKNWLAKIVHWKKLLLLLCGDVESNPGPPKQNIQCDNCSKPSTANNSLFCGFCEKWFHVTCTELSESDAKVFIEKDKLFICENCEASAKRYFRLEKRLENCEQKLEILDRKIDDVLNSLNELKSSPKPEVDFKSTFQEMFELETKKRNAVVFGLPDSGDDLAYLRDLAKNSLVKSSDILYTFKDGPDHDRSGKTIPQFNKVVFATSKARNLFLGWLKTHRPADPSIRARPDLTYAQREENRKLQSEINRRKDQGEENLRIDYRTMKIVSQNSVNNFMRTRSSVSKVPPK